MKKPFDVDLTLELIADAVRPFPKAAMFELAEAGFNSPFEQLVACMISIRTYDEVSLPTAKRLFAKARTPKQISHMTPEEIDALINTCTFHERKAEQIHTIANRIMDEYNGELRCDPETLLSFPGIGPKMRQSRFGHRLRTTLYQCGYSRPSRDEPLGLCESLRTRKDDGGT